MGKRVVKFGIVKEPAKMGNRISICCIMLLNLVFSLLVTVLHSIFNVADVPLKTVHFLQAGFDRHGDRLLAVDQRGNVYLFDLVRNK